MEQITTFCASIFEWLAKNIEWFFSGVGTELIVVLPLSIIGYIIKQSFDKKQARKQNEEIKSDRVDIVPNDIMYQDDILNELEFELDATRKLAQNFYKIYELHGVLRTQMPTFIDKRFGISLLDVKDEDSILHRLNDDLLDWTSEKFGIRRAWFEASDNDIYFNWMYDPFYLYKNTYALIELFSKLIDKYSVYTYKENIEVRCLRTFDKFKADETGDNSYIVVIIIEKVGKTSTSTIYKYKFTDGNLRWAYEKSRKEIKKIFRIIEKFDIYNVGYDIDIQEYEEIMSLSVVPKKILDSKRSVSWYPDDFDGTSNDRIDRLEQDDNSRYRDEFINIDKRITQILEDKRSKLHL